MKYLESFLAQYARSGAHLTKLPRGPSVSFVSAYAPCTDHEACADRHLDHGLAVREVLVLPAAWLPDLPIPTTLVLDVPGVDGPVTVGTHVRCAPAAFVVSEWRALTAAAENDRAWPIDLRKWSERKRCEPNWRLTADEALGIAVGIERPSWTVTRVLRQLGARLRAVVIEGGTS
jgi:hypothetical protein